MVEPIDMITPLLLEIRSKVDETHSELAGIKRRLDSIDQRQKGFSNALAADSLMSKMMIGDWEERIEALEAKVKQLEAAK